MDDRRGEIEQPLVTVYTITRNRCTLLPRAMKSILGQSYNNIEYIIIDSASTDDTENVVKGFCDSRIRYIKLEKNKTFGQCVNMAVSMAAGKYVTELDDDDEYCVDKLEKQIALFESLPDDYGMVYCWMTYYDNQTGKKLKVHKAEFRGDVLDEVVEKPTVSGTPTLLYKKEIFDRIGGYKESTEIGIESDWEFAARICKYCKVDYVPESLVNVYIKHSFLRMSNYSYYDDLHVRNIRFHQYFLNTFADVFEKAPQKSFAHLYEMTQSYLIIKNYKIFFIEYRRLWNLRPWNFKVIFLPIHAYARVFYHIFKK